MFCMRLASFDHLLAVLASCTVLPLAVLLWVRPSWWAFKVFRVWEGARKGKGGWGRLRGRRIPYAAQVWLDPEDTYLATSAVGAACSVVALVLLAAGCAIYCLAPPLYQHCTLSGFRGQMAQLLTRRTLLWCLVSDVFSLSWDMTALVLGVWLARRMVRTSSKRRPSPASGRFLVPSPPPAGLLSPPRLRNWLSCSARLRPASKTTRNTPNPNHLPDNTLCEFPSVSPLNLLRTPPR
eukprot:1177920-Prorocentrum_minimum.AAC.2